MEKLVRVSLTLPQELVNELDELLKAQKYPSRSEAVRDSLREFLANYKWRQGLKGEKMGIIAILYEHDVRGLAEKLVNIQHENTEIIKGVQHLHADPENCLETIIVKGSAERIRKLVDSLGALRGVKQAKLVIV